jgi:outer membrane protein OmpA-like peptidoglycan-associated protein
MKPGKNYLFKVVKMGYADATDAYETKVSAYTTSISHCIPMAKRSCTTLKGQVFNAVCKDKNIPVAKVTLLNKCTGELTQIESGSDGSYEFCLECGCEYELLGTKTNFSQDKQRVSLISKNCDETIVQNLNLTFGLFDDFASNPTPQNGNYPPNGGYPQNPGAYMSNNFGGNYNGNMMGRSIVLEKVYYDFNKYAIRPDAAQELDKIVQLLREFPSMEIELSSHTDARGTDKYNEILSQNRANAAVQYVISRGISASRLSAKGYGERYTRNRCKDEVDCTEEHHQYNRRTEVKITSFARYNEVRVDYKDNAPSVIDKADPSRKWIWD